MSDQNQDISLRDAALMGRELGLSDVTRRAIVNVSRRWMSQKHADGRLETAIIDVANEQKTRREYIALVLRNARRWQTSTAAVDVEQGESIWQPLSFPLFFGQEG